MRGLDTGSVAGMTLLARATCKFLHLKGEDKGGGDGTGGDICGSHVPDVTLSPLRHAKARDCHKIVSFSASDTKNPHPALSLMERVPLLAQATRKVTFRLRDPYRSQYLRQP